MEQQVYDIVFIYVTNVSLATIMQLKHDFIAAILLTIFASHIISIIISLNYLPNYSKWPLQYVVQLSRYVPNWDGLK